MKRIIGLKDFGESYDSLLSFGIIIVVEDLKLDGQWPSSKHVLVMLIILFKHTLSLTILLRYLHDSLLGLGVDKLLYLAFQYWFVNFEPYWIMNEEYARDPWFWSTGDYCIWWLWLLGVCTY